MPPRDGKPWKRPKADYVFEKKRKEAHDISDRMDADVKFP